MQTSSWWSSTPHGQSDCCLRFLQKGLTLPLSILIAALKIHYLLLLNDLPGVDTVRLWLQSTRRRPRSWASALLPFLWLRWTPPSRARSPHALESRGIPASRSSGRGRRLSTTDPERNMVGAFSAGCFWGDDPTEEKLENICWSLWDGDVTNWTTVGRPV